MTTLLLLVLSAVGLAAEPDASALVERTVVARHDPGCDVLLATSDTAAVREALIAATEREAPPWAPLRAAGCLAELAATDDAAWAATRDLVARPEQPGFALAVAAHLDVLPAPRAAELAGAIATHAQDSARIARALAPTFAGSRHAEVRAVALPVAP